MNRSKYADRGFTLIELIVGLLILSVVSGLALNAFINASKDFSQDKKTIDSSQNLSAILEIIGNDIKQAGEQISDGNFPAIEISQNNANSSTITVRRALTTRALTLCEEILTADPVRTRIVVADTAQATNSNCNTLPANPLVSSEPAPNGFVEARNYRCKLGDPNANYSTSTDYCATALASSASNSTLQNVRGAIHRNGRIRIFTYTGEDISDSTKSKLVVDAPALASGSPNDIIYPINSVVHLIEERQYTLVTTGAEAGNLQVSVDGAAPTTLIRGIDRFKVSAKRYTNPNDRIILASPPAGIACTATDGVVIPTTPTSEDPIYGCRLNDGVNLANWKEIAGVRVELQAKYDSTGRAATASAADTDKLTARAEFFPRNVLSK